MNQAAPDLVISADGHVTEPSDLWVRELPASMRGRGPRVEGREGRLCFVVEDEIVRKLPVPVDSAAGRVAEGPIDFGWGTSDPQKRLEVLESDGVWAEVLYPNVAFFCVFHMRDPELQVASCEVYNAWLSDTYRSHDRYAPVGLLPTRDLEATVRMLRDFPARGLRAALVPCHDDARPYNDPVWEPLWEAAAGVGVPLSFHVGTGRSQTPAHGPGAAVVNYVVTVSAPMETVSYLCASGVLERHPELRVVMIECGAGWLAWTLDAMDEAYEEHAAFVKPKLREKPSDSFRRQGAVTFQRDPVGLANAARTGARCLMWASDYPHPEGTYPESRAVLARQLEGIPRDVAEAATFRNAAELYGLPLPAAGS
ncbi:MAG: hypothetical protein CL910_09580 [Deltaproteobacteria bacterium]|jgi:predicted TIM-barrel fold metal-dependent hydrolase|nr:hypothetical protein [Deltaproteobacteria bacterium]